MVLVVAVVSKLSECLAVVTHRPAVVKVNTLSEKRAIMHARRWSIHWQAETLVEVEANAAADTLFETR